MTYQSVLFPDPKRPAPAEETPMPEHFRDLNLDQIVTAVVAKRREYHLEPFLYTPLTDCDTVRYRQDIFRDLESEPLLERIEAFAEAMRVMRRYANLSDSLRFRYHREGWFMEAAAQYCEAVEGLVLALDAADLASSGLQTFRAYLHAYTASADFVALRADVRQLQAELATVRYCVVIDGLTVTVRPYAGEADYRAEVEGTFERFKQGAVKDYRANFLNVAGMSHVEAEILARVATFYPAIFQSLLDFYARHRDYLDDGVARFDREIQFYMAYRRHIATFQASGLSFCYPEVTTETKEEAVHDAFDLALARKCLAAGAMVVTNDYGLGGPERAFVVSGPNQGGKTTFARMVGQLHYLAGLGCPVPGSAAQLFLPDRIFAHFEREEHIQNLRGKLQDDLVRIRRIVNEATPRSIVILNEVFSSTTEVDAAFLSTQIMARLLALDLLCVWVTFIDELASLSEKTVSVVSTVDPEDPTLRTFKIVRRPADGLAYALSIARKHCLTYETLKERIAV